MTARKGERLSSEDEARLVAACKAGDRAAADALVRANLGLVGHFALACRGRGLDGDDLLQEGAIALWLAAAGDYDPARGALAAYVRYKIRAAAFRATVLTGGIVRVGHHATRRLRAGRRSGATTPEALAEAGLLKLDVARRALMMLDLRSANTTVDADGAPTAEAVADEDTPAPGAALEAEDLARFVREKLLTTLTEREQRVAEARIMAEPEDMLTLEELGAEMGLSRERVRQIEEELLGRLRKRWEVLEAEEERRAEKRRAEGSGRRAASRKCER